MQDTCLPGCSPLRPLAPPLSPTDGRGETRLEHSETHPETGRCSKLLFKKAGLVGLVCNVL